MDNLFFGVPLLGIKDLLAEVKGVTVEDGKKSHIVTQEKCNSIQ
ncbi:MAG: hypothetical protein V7L25_14230 [Nostoc sp.]